MITVTCCRDWGKDFGELVRICIARLTVLTAMRMKITVFCDMMSCQLMNIFLLKCRGLQYLSFFSTLSAGRLVR